jgi:hypothetical protein
MSPLYDPSTSRALSLFRSTILISSLDSGRGLYDWFQTRELLHVRGVVPPMKFISSVLPRPTANRAARLRSGGDQIPEQSILSAGPLAGQQVAGGSTHEEMVTSLRQAVRLAEALLPNRPISASFLDGANCPWDACVDNEYTAF